MNTKVEFDHIQTDLNPKGYLKQLLERLKPDEFKNVLPGEYIEFTIPSPGTVTFTFVGEMPEKYEIMEHKIKVLMTKCVLILIYKDNKDGHMTTRMEVASALF